MLTTIVVGVDGRPAADDALALAAALSRLDDADVVVAAAAPEEAPGDAAHAIARARAHLGAPANVTYEVVHAETAARALLLAVAAYEADVVVLGSSHVSRAGHAFGSDMLDRLLAARVPVPVAVAPKGYATGAHALDRIGIAYDGTAASDAAAGFAAGLVRASAERPAQVAAIYVDPHPEGLERRPDGEPVAATAARHRAVEGVLARIADRLPATVDVEHVELHGAPADRLATLTAGLDLLVVGTHPRGTLDRLLQGSVATGVAAHAACPVVVVGA